MTKKSSYLSPCLRWLPVQVEGSFLASGGGTGTGSDLGDPDYMSGDDFNNIFG